MTSDNTFGIEASSPPSPRVIGWILVLYFLTGILGTVKSVDNSKSRALAARA